MKFNELKQLIDLYDDFHQNPEVVIKIKMPYSTVGAMPTVKVRSVHMGFDWDAGKLIIYPEEELTPSDRDFANQMSAMQERTYSADRENRGLKAEIRRLNKLLAGKK